MDPTDATNPETPEVEEVATDETPETDMDDTEADVEASSDEEQPEQTAEDEFIELEVGGKKIKLPKDAEPLLMFQKDYTQKTQSLAEERRMLETEREATKQEREVLSKIGRDIHELDIIDERLEYLRSVDPSTLPPPVLMQYTAEKASLENRFSQLSARANQTAEELRQQQSKAEAERNEANWRKVTTPNPSIFWDGKFDQARSQELTRFAAETLGISPDEQRRLGPEFVATFNLAKVGLETLRKQAATLKKPPAAPVQPVKEVTGKKTASTMTLRDMDKLSMDKWLEQRNKQLARRG